MMADAFLVKTMRHTPKQHKAAAAGLAAWNTGGHTATTTMQLQGLMEQLISW
jgi:hypothetical protein